MTIYTASLDTQTYNEEITWDFFRDQEKGFKKKIKSI